MHTLTTILLLAIGLSIIILLVLRARKRAHLLAQRIAEVQAEMERDPTPPYAALATLMQEQASRDQGD